MGAIKKAPGSGDRKHPRGMPGLNVATIVTDIDACCWVDTDLSRGVLQGCGGVVGVLVVGVVLVVVLLRAVLLLVVAVGEVLFVAALLRQELRLHLVFAEAVAVAPLGLGEM